MENALAYAVCCPRFFAFSLLHYRPKSATNTKMTKVDGIMQVSSLYLVNSPLKRTSHLHLWQEIG